MNPGPHLSTKPEPDGQAADPRTEEEPTNNPDTTPLLTTSPSDKQRPDGQDTEHQTALSSGFKSHQTYITNLAEAYPTKDATIETTRDWLRLIFTFRSLDINCQDLCLTCYDLEQAKYNLPWIASYFALHRIGKPDADLVAQDIYNAIEKYQASGKDGNTIAFKIFTTFVIGSIVYTLGHVSYLLLSWLFSP
ncbi:hypothetical protein CSOJ01_08539 [Colletotrichum sojae]|uniref:Uncharacterized protein n=1 Tax=Colletotrichum sojae TaxID=2175907 RepID=A0A8H6J5R6_9PEZI|nr:hypothetical protein CSOJ01_08539 [Colletotrichum sojae]